MAKLLELLVLLISRTHFCLISVWLGLFHLVSWHTLDLLGSVAFLDTKTLPTLYEIDFVRAKDGRLCVSIKSAKDCS
jgi:hypothetical protein